MIFHQRVFTVRELVDQAAGIQPEAACLLSPETGRVLTCRELQQQCIVLSTLLSRIGLQRRDKVALLMDNGLVTAQLFLGAMYGGFVAVPLNVRGGVVQLSYMLEHCDAKILFVEEQYQSLLSDAMREVRRPIEVILTNSDGTIGDFETDSVGAPLDSPVPEDEALLIYSSGSTGQPKAAIHTHASVLAGGRNAMASHELTSADRSLLVLPLYHINAECVTLIPTLLSGGSVVVPRRFSVSNFWDWIDDFRCTWSALVPTIISELVNWDDPHKDRRRAAFERIRFFRSSSAPLAPSLHREFLEKFKLPLLQAMGSTEGGNVFSNPAPPRKNKIGSPGLPWGFETRIVDPNALDVSPGESGEVLLRGPALMRGYYKDSEGTAAVVDAEGWLHTGDLAYRDEDGYFFIVGRSKELVIKGGVNIAPRQIDEALESHPAVLEAAAVGIPDRHLGEDLVAFVVLRAGATTDQQELLSYCEKRLGHFKTPTWIRLSKDLPKGPSGKVQRLKLVEEALAPAAAAIAWPRKENGTANGNGHRGTHQNWQERLPSTEIENVIAGSWAAILGVPRVDPHDNFFALGGHSLLAIQCLSRLREKLPVALTLSDFFEHSSVAEQADLVRQRLRSANGSSGTEGVGQSGVWEQTVLRQFAPPPEPVKIPSRDRSLPCPLSPGQQRLWFLEQLNRGVPVYNEAEAVRLRGPLNVEALEQSLNGIVSRHEVLRTTFQLIEERPYSVVHESWPLRLKKIDLSALAASERESEMNRLLVDEPRALYRLEVEPGIRTTLLRLGPEDHVLILMMHHLIVDWASEGVFWRDLSALYRSYNNKGKPALLPGLPIQHADYADWQNQEINQTSFADDLAFWEENLRGAPPLLELPADRPRPPVMSHRGARKRWNLSRTLTEALRTTSRSEKASLFTILTAALNSLLYRYSGSDDISVGIPIADRDQKELQELIGFLLHVHVLRTRLSGDLTFRELLARTQKGVLDLYEHRRVPFDQVVRRVQPKRNPGYSSLFQVMIIWRDREQQLSVIGLDGLQVESLVAESATSKFDLMLFATDFGDQISLELEYSTDLFDEPRILRMLGNFETLLEAVTADPGSRVAELPLLTTADRQKILFDMNRTEIAWPGDPCLDELIEEQAKRSPDAVAVLFEDTQLTYRELNERADRLAAHLRALGVGPGVLAGISVERSAAMVVGLLGILKTGGAYLPLDPSYPSDRVACIIQDARPLVMMAQRRVMEKVPAGSARLIDLDSLLALEPQDGSRNAAAAPRRSSDLAYVLYTSGSTGAPKGVQIPHRALVNFLRSMQREPGIAADDTLVAVTTLSFDIAGLELFLPLITGARVVIAADKAVSDPARLSSLIERSRATIMQATPATWRLLLNSGWAGSPQLKILCGGEPWSSELAEQLLPMCRSLWNMYGPTETTIWSSVARVEKGQPVRIGAPIANTTFYILDAHRQPVPVGFPGELYIGGDGLASGYLGRPDLTAERFVGNPFREQPDAVLFKTGDLVRRVPGGGIEFLHRIDHQIKLRGFRIELEEIEFCLEHLPGVRQAVVVVQGDEAADKSLAAFVVPEDTERPPRGPELRATLRHQLPSYMIPASFGIVDEIPLTPSGKIDRKALSAVDRVAVASSPAEPIPCRTAIELQITKIWEQFLNCPVASVSDSFFDLGGHSLLAVRLINEVNRTFNAGLTIPAFLNDPTIAGMHNLLRHSAAIREPKLIPLIPGTQPGTVVFLGSGVGHCRLGQALEGPAVFASIVPFAISGSEAPTLDGHALPTLQQMASVYAKLVLGAQDGGPCVLVGHSFTGLLAFEVAHQMAAIGRPVDTIILIDAWARQSAWHQKLRTLSFSRTRSKAQRMLSRASQLFRGVMVRRPGPLPETYYQSLDEMPPETFLQVVRNALKGYRPAPLDCRAVLFLARESHNAHLHSFDPSLGWNNLFSGGLEIVAMPGDHSSILLRANLPGLAKQLREHLPAVMVRGQSSAQPISQPDHAMLVSG
jgi:amino acid adenylation domain-containing protein